MDNLTQKLNNLTRRRHRIRAKIAGTAERPRLSVKISARHITVQLIDDSRQTTLAYVTTVGQKLEGNLSEKASWAGGQIAAKAKAAKLKKVVFDRGGRQYHGRVKALAEAARAQGMEF